MSHQGDTVVTMLCLGSGHSASDSHVQHWDPHVQRQDLDLQHQDFYVQHRDFQLVLPSTEETAGIVHLIRIFMFKDAAKCPENGERGLPRLALAPISCLFGKKIADPGSRNVFSQISQS